MQSPCPSDGDHFSDHAIRERMFTVTGNSFIARREGWIAAWVEDNLIMMHAESSFYLSFTGSGGRIWELLKSPRSVSDLCKALGREFDIEPEAVRPEVLAFLDRLLLRKAIDVYIPSLE